MKDRSNELNVIQLLDKLRTMAQLGLNYTQDPYDRLRFKELLELTSETYTHFTGTHSKDIYKAFRNDVGHITPKVSVNGALFDAAGQILLEKRTDDNCWGLPGGYGDIGESPEESLVREFREETGLIVEPVELIGVYTRLAGHYDYPHTLWQILYSCKKLGGKLTISEESSELAYHEIHSNLNWHKDHHRMALAAIEFLKQKDENT